MFAFFEEQRRKELACNKRRSVKFVASIIVWSVITVFLLAGLSSCGSSSDPGNNIQSFQIRNAKITTFSKAFMVEYPSLPHYPKVVAVQGTSYERGYQQGFLMADMIIDNLSGFLTPVYAQYGGWVPDGITPPTKAQWETGRQVLLATYNKYFDSVLKTKAPELYEELQGMAAGLKAAGHEVEWADVLVGNFIPEVTTGILFVSLPATSSSKAIGGPAECSHAMAWGGATIDGRLLHGMNYDYSTYGVLNRNLVMLVVKPDKGLAFIGGRNPGTVGQHRGMNEMGLTVGESTSQSFDNDLRTNPRITDHMTLRKILQNASNIQEAIDLTNQYGPGTTGYNHSIGDGRARTARVLETSCNHLAVIMPRAGFDALASTNHYTAYPGYQSYEGYNMVMDQMKSWEIPWSDVDTVEKWTAKLRNSKVNMDSWGRSETIKSMISASYGQIDVQKMIQILSAYPVSLTPAAPVQYAPACNQLYGFYRPIVNQQLLSIMSAVFDPANKTVWVAAGDTPAQKGTYYPIDFAKVLQTLTTWDFQALIP